MISAGFCVLLDPAGILRSEDFLVLGLPMPGQGRPGVWHYCRGDACHARSPDGATDMFFHGELYDRPDLARQLGLAQDPLPQVLLAAYTRWGDRLGQHLEGLYALAVLEGGRMRLFRDRSGARDLFHRPQPGNGLAVATDLDSLLRMPGGQRRLAPRSLHEYLRFLDISAPHTLYREVGALEPGQAWLWPPGQDLAGELHPVHPDLPGDEEGAADELQVRMQNALARRLACSDRPAAFLSGGVDSALICALAAKQRPDLQAVTVGFQGDGLDESPAAASIARHLGLTHQVHRYDRPRFLKAFQAFQSGAAQPVGDPAVPPTLLVFRDCVARHDVVLDGSGADEALGLPPPRHVRVAVEYAALLPPLVRRGCAGLLGHLPGLDGYRPIFAFDHPAELSIRWGGFSRREIAELCGQAVDFGHTRFFRTFGRFPRQAHFQRYSALLDCMPGDRLHEGARLTGLRLRFPFWDREVDDYLRGLPESWRYRPDSPKHLLRLLLARHVPRPLWDTPKHGFDFPLADLLRGQDGQMVRRYLFQADWRDWSLLSPRLVEDYGRRFLAGDDRLVFRVWALAVLAAWLETHDWDH